MEGSVPITKMNWFVLLREVMTAFWKSYGTNMLSMQNAVFGSKAGGTYGYHLQWRTRRLGKQMIFCDAV